MKKTIPLFKEMVSILTNIEKGDPYSYRAGREATARFQESTSAPGSIASTETKEFAKSFRRFVTATNTMEKGFGALVNLDTNLMSMLDIKSNLLLTESRKLISGWVRDVDSERRGQYETMQSNAGAQIDIRKNAKAAKENYDANPSAENERIMNEANKRASAAQGSGKPFKAYVKKTYY